MEFLKENWARTSYVSASVLIIILASHYKVDVLASTQGLNEFSYIGTVATIIALMISIFEVMHSVSISKSIRSEAEKLLENSRNINGASLISECLSELDEANAHIRREEYILALKCFQHFRRQYVRVSSKSEEIGKIDGLLSSIEFELHMATHTSPNAPLEKKKQRKLQKDLLSIKECLEKINPARGFAHAAK